jgi:hypothetical protein
MKCRVHPAYVGKGKPRSKNPKCVCSKIHAQAEKRKPKARKWSIDVEDDPLAFLETAPEAEIVTTDLPRFSNGRPKPIINREPLLESADSFIEATLAQKHPELHQVRAPEGYRLRGASTLVDGAGNVVQQWVKTAKVQDDPAFLVEICKAAILADPIPAAPVVKKPKATAAELEVAVVIGDAHFGMLSWARETGDDWDVNIARRVHLSAIRQALSLAPPSSRLLLINLGDAVHSDGNNAQTTAGTRVDVDSRWAKVVEIFVQTMNTAITEGLANHDHVEVVNIPGNHDSQTALMIRMILAAYWRDNPRVTVADNLKTVWGHQFGNSLICAMHGDKTRLNNIPSLIAEDFRKEWGNTKHTVIYAGHLHHSRKQEFPGIEVEYFRVLCPKDSWHASEGYRSKRSLRCDIWHREYGRVTMHEIGIEQFEHA